MNSTLYRAMYWIAAVLLLALSGWLCNLATYNWFAADFHNQYSRAYASRGNTFAIVALASFIASITVVVLIFRRRKQERAK